MKTHCKYGHEFDKINVYISPKGMRACRACDARRKKEYYLRKYPNRPRRGTPEQSAHGTYNRYVNYQCRCDLCKEARREWDRLHVSSEQRAKYRQRIKEYYHANKEKVSLANKKRYLAGGNIKHRRYKLKKVYNLTLEDYYLLLEKQGGGCAVCGIKKSGLNDNRALAVDHNHTSGKVRGILCHPCNRALGLLREDEKIIMSLLIYKQKEGVS